MSTEESTPAQDAAPAPVAPDAAPAAAPAAASDAEVVAPDAEAEAEAEVESPQTPEETEMLKQMYAMQMKSQMVPSHKFWDTQPVPKFTEDTNTAEMGPVDAMKTVDQVRQVPYNLPKPFEWVTVNVGQEGEMQEVYQLLADNYVEDDDNMFRFDYSIPFLEWALTPPGYNKDWHVGVRHGGTGKLVAFITGVPAKTMVHQKEMMAVAIDFLCVHKKLRTKRLAPVLIKEVTRRINLKDIWQAVYTAGVVLPKPMARCRYYHRTLRIKKLVESNFTRLAPRMTMARSVKLHRLPEDPVTPGFREMLPGDVPRAHKLLMNYLRKFKLYTEFTEEEFAHWMLPRDGVVNSYVVEDNENNITDFASFYHLPSTIIGNEKHKTLFAAYSFYTVATSQPLKVIMKDVLAKAYKQGMDVFNALDVMDNASVFQDLKFGIGDGHLQYYLYNWRCPEVDAKDVALVLL